MEKHWAGIGRIYIGGYVASMMAIILPGSIFGVFGYIILLILTWRLKKATQQTPGFLHFHIKRLISIGISGGYTNSILAGFVITIHHHLYETTIELIVISINLIIAYGNHAGSMDYNKGKEPHAVFAFK